MSKPNLLTPEFIFSNSTPVPEAGCWLWNKYIKRDGYGHFRSFNKKVLAHRASYIAFFGDIPEGLLVCHKCDTPSCVNPEHLFLGTHKENSEDRNNKGRQATGLTHGKAKLSEADVQAIRNSTKRYKDIAHEFGVSLGYIKAIRRGVRRNV